MEYSEKLGAECRKRAAKKWGIGWRMLSDEQKQGAVALEVVSVVLAVAAAPLNDEPNSTVVHLQAVGRAALYP